MKFFNILRYDIQNGYLAKPQKWCACILLCVCNIVTVTTFYTLGYSVLFILSTLTAKHNILKLNPTIFSFIFAQKLPLQDTSASEMLLALCVLPCVVSVCINLMQMTLTLFIKPIFAFTITAIYIITGIFYVHPIMLTNFAMPARSSVIGFYNLTIIGAFICCIAFSIVAIVVGAIKINKKDILNTVS